MRRLAASLWVLALFCADTAASQPEDVAASLALVSDGDPLEVARIVANAGDDAVLALIAADAGASATLYGIGASRWLAAPEAALPRLSELAGGRDPDLAPAAARQAHRIASMVDHDVISGRDVASQESMVEVISVLRSVADDESARPDIRQLAALAADELAAETVPPAPAP